MEAFAIRFPIPAHFLQGPVRSTWSYTLGRNAIGALAILLCALVIGAMVLHERCRLGNQNWQLSGWMGIPHAGGPFPQP